MMCEWCVTSWFHCFIACYFLYQCLHLLHSTIKLNPGLCNQHLFVNLLWISFLFKFYELFIYAAHFIKLQNNIDSKRKRQPVPFSLTIIHILIRNPGYYDMHPKSWPFVVFMINPPFSLPVFFKLSFKVNMNSATILIKYFQQL